MNQVKILIIVPLTLFVILGLSLTSSAAQPYVLNVQQVKDGLDKVSDPLQKGFVLVDVRTPEEHQEGFIPGTDFNIDYRELPQRYRDLEAKLEDHIVVYCQTGHRSNIAANTLMELGYKHVYNVEGSMNAWQEAGYAVEHPR
ncbi:rhodanese-like domain-containing protein [Candidatus Nitrospira salsa]|nr:MAG: sulfurtransferase [Nitrospirales bacterium]